MKKITVINVSMTTLSPLYTGEVREEEKRGARINFPIRKTFTGKVLVPFKGPLRAALEIMLPGTGKQVCNTGAKGSRPCGQCLICSLFGSMSKKGRISVDFLISDEDKRQIVREASHTRIDRERGSVSDTFKGEEVIEGAVFKSKIIINNPSQEDVNLIKAALSFIEEHGLGGWVNKGYGRVKFEISIEEFDKERFIAIQNG